MGEGRRVSSLSSACGGLGRRRTRKLEALASLDAQDVVALCRIEIETPLAGAARPRWMWRSKKGACRLFFPSATPPTPRVDAAGHAR